MKKYQFISGLVALVAGIVLLCYGIYGSYRMKKARRDIDLNVSYIPERRMKEMIEQKLYEEVDEYRLPVMLCYIGAIVLVTGGTFLIYYGRKK